MLIEYQSGAVVSKTLLKKKGGTVTVFAFDAGQELSEHTAPFDALVHVLDGRLDITVAGSPHSVSAGEVLTMPANKPHALKAPEPAKMMLIMIRE